MGVDLADLTMELAEIEGIYPLPLPIPDYISDLSDRGVITREEEHDLFMDYIYNSTSD